MSAVQPQHEYLPPQESDAARSRTEHRANGDDAVGGGLRDASAAATATQGAGAVGGLLAGVALLPVLWICAALDIDLLLPDLLGSWLIGGVGMSSAAIGAGLFVAAAAVLGHVYDGVMRRVLGRSSWYGGLSLAILQLLILGIALALLPAVHPLVPAVIDNPGPFLVDRGGEAATLFVGLHLAFGLFVGAYCAPSRASTADGRGR